jgi:hypothetical protein
MGGVLRKFLPSLHTEPEMPLIARVNSPFPRFLSECWRRYSVAAVRA